MSDILRAHVYLKDRLSTVSLESNNPEQIKKFIADFANLDNLDKLDKTDPPAGAQDPAVSDDKRVPKEICISDMQCALAGPDGWGGISVILADRIMYDQAGHMKPIGKTVSIHIPKKLARLADLFDSRSRYSLTITRIEE